MRSLLRHSLALAATLAVGALAPTVASGYTISYGSGTPAQGDTFVGTLAPGTSLDLFVNGFYIGSCFEAEMAGELTSEGASTFTDGEVPAKITGGTFPDASCNPDVDDIAGLPWKLRITSDKGGGIYGGNVETPQFQVLSTWYVGDLVDGALDVFGVPGLVEWQNANSDCSGGPAIYLENAVGAYNSGNEGTLWGTFCISLTTSGKSDPVQIN